MFGAGPVPAMLMLVGEQPGDQEDMAGEPFVGPAGRLLRDALAVDVLDPAGVYFGTRNGQLYGSADEGKTWEKILDGLPPIVCVKTGVVGGHPPALPGRKQAPDRWVPGPARRPAQGVSMKARSKRTTSRVRRGR